MDDQPRASPRTWLRGLSPARLPRDTPASTSTSSRPPTSRKTTPYARLTSSKHKPAPTPSPPSPPSSPPTTTPLITLSSHPDILHKIINHAPRRLLLTLRCVSRTLRRRADALLAHHLTVTSSPKGLTISSTLGQVPGLIWLPAYNNTRSQILLYSKVLDIRGPIDAPLLQGLGLNHIPTVRFRENSAGYRPQSCEEGHTRVIAFATLSPDHEGVCPLLCPVPESARCLTITLRCFAGCPSPLPPFRAGGLRSVVMIFRTAKKNRGRRNSAVREGQWGLVSTLAGVIAKVRGVKFTLVGVESLDAANLGFPLLANFGGKVGEGFARRKILEAVAAGVRGYGCEGEVSEAIGDVEFIEWSEYRARVSAEVFRLETVEDITRFSAC